MRRVVVPIVTRVAQREHGPVRGHARSDVTDDGSPVPATPYNDTAVVDTTWDGAAAQAHLSNDAGQATYERVYAWRDPSKDADTKAAYKLPHHEVDANGKPGAANAAGCRSALAAIGGARGGVAIPSGDVAAVKSHLQKHLDKYNAGKDKGDSTWEYVDEVAVEVGMRAAVRVQVDSRVWAINPRVLAALCSLDGQSLAQATVAELEAARPKPSAQPNGGVAIVALHGVLMPSGGGLMSLLFGGAGLSSFQSDLRAAVADDSVSAIVIDVDSPGGLVDHIPETAAQIRAARAAKPVVAVANTQADSAAYWLASQADEISVTPSGEVGSIGVYRLHRDTSEAHAMRGIAPTLISAGKYKVEGNPYEPLADDARAAMQDEVDDYYGMFVGDVARGRDVSSSDVTGGYGEGRALHARQAVKAGLADRVETLGDAVRRIVHPRGRAALEDRRAAWNDALEARAAHQDDRDPEIAYTPEERSRLLAVLAE